MIKKLLEKLLYRAYLIAKEKETQDLEAFRRNDLCKNAIIGSNTRLTNEVVIQNAQNKKESIKIGDNCLVRGHLLVYKHGGTITIGDDCFIGQHSRIWSAKEIYIGNRVLVSHNVNIHDNNSHPLNSEERHKDFVHIFNIGLQNNVNLNEKEVIIEDDVWIGFNSTIFKGIRIGKGAIIGACSVITEDVPPYAVVVGNPSRIIKYVE